MVEVPKIESELPKFNKNQKSCRYALFAEKDDGVKLLVPLTNVEIKSELRGALATTNVELKYLNPSETNPLECTYTYPLEKTSFLAKLEVVIDDRIIETKIQDKEKAKERYDDAMASGKAAVFAE